MGAHVNNPGRAHSYILLYIYVHGALPPVLIKAKRQLRFYQRWQRSSLIIALISRLVIADSLFTTRAASLTEKWDFLEFGHCLHKPNQEPSNGTKLICAETNDGDTSLMTIFTNSRLDFWRQLSDRSGNRVLSGEIYEKISTATDSSHSEKENTL